MTTFHYFAYGSNLLPARLLARTPSAVSLGAASLPGYALRWHKLGHDGSGKCDIVPDSRPGTVVHGALYRIALAEKPLLDAAEALGVGYTEQQLGVQAGQGRIQAWAYLGLNIDPQAVPYDWYKALVVQGAHWHRLPADYLAALAAVACQPDADSDRAAVHFKLAGLG